MAEPEIERVGPLDGLEADMAAVSREGAVLLRVLVPAVQVDLRGDPMDASFAGSVCGVLGFDLPAVPNRFVAAGGVTALWLGPDEWLLVGDTTANSDLEGRLRAALQGKDAAVTEVSAARAVIELTGPKAREVLAKGCALDLHPRAFGPGQCAQTLLAKAEILIQQTGEAPAYRIFVRPSFAAYLVAWLMDAMREYRS